MPLFLLVLLLDSCLQQGLMALRDGKLVEAKADFQAAVQQDPKNAFAWVSLAETCRRTGDAETANDAAQRAEEFGGSVPAVDHALASFYTQQGQFARAAKFEERYAAIDTADAKAPLRTAELYERAGDLPAAERVLKAAWERRSDDPDLAFNYAQLLLNKFDFVTARTVVAGALAAHSKDPQLLLASGVALYGQREFSDAMSEFLKVIAIDPSIPQPYQFLGKMLEQAGPKLPAIAQALEARVKAAPDDASANLVLAKVKLAANSKDPSAELLLRHSLSADSDQWEAYYELGVLLEGRHAYTEAAQELSRAIALSPKQPTPHYHLARVYDRLGQPEQAQAERKVHEELSQDK